MGRHPVDDALNIIEYRICQASWVLSRMPSDRPASYRHWWPPYDYDEQEEIKDIRPRPQKIDIDQMHEVFDKWLPLLSVEERRLVHMRCGSGKIKSWRKVSWMSGNSHEQCRMVCRLAYLLILQKIKLPEIPGNNDVLTK